MHDAPETALSPALMRYVMIPYRLLIAMGKVDTKYQRAGIMTKALPCDSFQMLLIVGSALQGSVMTQQVVIRFFPELLSLPQFPPCANSDTRV